VRDWQRCLAAASVEASVRHVERTGDKTVVVLELASDSRMFCQTFAESLTFGLDCSWRVSSADELVALGGFVRVERWGERARRAKSAAHVVLLTDVARLVALIVWDSRCDMARSDFNITP
jgi:hypothetical protein